MEIEIITVPHPSFFKREISLLLVNNMIDVPSSEFLTYEARYGGRNGLIAGKSRQGNQAELRC